MVFKEPPAELVRLAQLDREFYAAGKMVLAFRMTGAQFVAWAQAPGIQHTPEMLAFAEKIRTTGQHLSHEQLEAELDEARFRLLLRP